MALVRAAHPEVDHSPDALEERLRRLESGSVPVAPVSTAGARSDRRAPPPSRPGWCAAAEPRPAPAPAAATRSGPGGGAEPGPCRRERRARPLPSRRPRRRAPTHRPTQRRPPARRRRAPPARAGRRPATRRRQTTRQTTGATDPEHAAAAQSARRRRARRARRRRRPRQARLAARPPAGREPRASALYAVIKDARVRAEGDRLVLGLPSSLTLRQGLDPRQPRAAHRDHRAHDGRRPRPAVRARAGPRRSGRAALGARCRPHHRPAHRPRQARARRQRATRRRLDRPEGDAPP